MKIANFKRVTSCLAVLLAVLLIVPVQAFAVEMADGKLDIAASGEYSWDTTTTPGTIALTVGGANSSWSTRTGKLTVSNKAGIKSSVTFDYTVSGSVNSLKINGASVSNSGGQGNVQVSAGSSFEIEVKVKGKSTATVSFSNFKCVEQQPKNSVVTFDSSLGSVTMDGTAVQNGTTVSVSPDGATFKATPKSGAIFLGWVDPATWEIKSLDAEKSFAFAQDTPLEAVFIGSSAPAHFRVGTLKLFNELQAALTYASSASTKTVICMNDGKITGQYSVPSGVTLLVPFDAAGTLRTTTPKYVEGEAFVKPTAFRTLTLADGASITVQSGGAISVSGSQNTVQGSNGSPTGPLGFIKMEGKSSITVQNGGNLYVWGYITGSKDAKVTIKSGGTVYENFQIVDWRGGGASSTMILDGTMLSLLKTLASGKVPDNPENPGTFPMSQYYVQNVEVAMTLESGAVETGCTAVELPLINVKDPAVPFIGPNGMFRLSNGGSITKRYDSATDRLIIDLEGNMEMAGMVIDIAKYLSLEIKIDSSKYVLPLASNMTVNMNSGANITIKQNMSLLPGSVINVEEGAVMTVSDGKALYAYDEDEWKANSYVYNTTTYFRPLKYVPGQTYIRTVNDLVDAEINVQGTLNATSGYLYTTAGGANIHSSGKGKVTLTTNTSPSLKLVEAVQSSSNLTYVYPSFTPAKLVNENGEYVSTSGSSATAYNYDHHSCKCEETDHGIWVAGNHTETVTTVAATCETAGSVTTTCTCGHQCVEIIRAIGHSWDDGVQTVAPNCTEAGMKTFTCQNDNTHTYTASVDALGHDMQPMNGQAATCTEAGWTDYTDCSRCDYTEGKETINALGHNYTSEVTTAPTCTAAGVKTYTCVCGETKTEEVAMIDHEYDDATCTAPATCSCGATTGIALGHDWDNACDTDCNREGCTETREITHAWNDGEVTTAPTCTTEGEKTYTCVCGETKTEEVAMIDHEYDDATCTDPATCYCGATTGTALGHDWDNACDTDCNREGCTETREITHAWNDGEVTTDPTCTTLGEKTYTCGVCGETKTEDVAMAEHEWVDATCAEPKHCENCTATEGETLPHTQWDEGVVTTDPTCTSLGVKTFTCVCGETKTEDVAMIDHEYDDATCTDPATCYCGATTGTALGHTWTNACDTDCNREGCTETRVITHAWNDGVVTTDPTCTTLGEKTYTCGVCGEEDYEEVAMAAHEWVDATCAEPKHCENCTATEGETLPHTQWDEGVVTTDPTCTTLGEKTYTCVCGETKTEEVAMIAHEYDDATCTEPATCYCGATTGDALGHAWVDATCAEPKHCENCPATEGDALGHDWNDATCEDPKTCKNCPATDGDPRGHSFTDYVSNEDATCTADGTKTAQCDNCTVTDTVVDDGTKKDHVEGTAVEENRKASTTLVKGGYDMVVYCANNCGTELSRQHYELALAANPFVAVNMNLDSSLALNFLVDVNGMDEGFTAKITRTYSGNINGGTGVTAPYTYDMTDADWEWYNRDAGQVKISYQNLAAKEMCDQITITIYNAAGDVYAVKTDSAQAYGQRMVDKYTKTGSVDRVRAAMYVDMLNYGTAAQLKFKYCHTDPNKWANAGVSDAQQEYATPDVADATDIRSKGVGYVGTRLLLENSITMEIAVKSGDLKDAAYAIVSYTGHYGKAEHVYSKRIERSDFTGDGSNWHFKAPGLAIADGKTVVTLTIYNNNNEAISVTVDSMESYAGRQKDGGDAWDIHKTILKFSRSAYAYFHRNGK